MAAAYSYITGDGIVADYLQISLQLPDANGGNAMCVGTVTPVGGSAVAVNQSITLPAAPGSGQIWWAIECNHTTGVCSLLQNTSGVNTPDPNNDIIFQDILTTTTTDPSLDPNNQDQ